MTESTAHRPPQAKRKRWTVRVLVGLLGLLIVLAVGGALWLHGRLKASLPLLDGEQVVEGLSAAVTVERDDLGVPTITAANRVDLARATGFVHAQERFFQMDLLRRQSAGDRWCLADRSASGHRLRREFPCGFRPQGTHRSGSRRRRWRSRTVQDHRLRRKLYPRLRRRRHRGGLLAAGVRQPTLVRWRRPAGLQQALVTEQPPRRRSRAPDRWSG